jgi:hypothetical protein
LAAAAIAVTDLRKVAMEAHLCLALYLLLVVEVAVWARVLLQAQLLVLLGVLAVVVAVVGHFRAGKAFQVKVIVVAQAQMEILVVHRGVLAVVAPELLAQLRLQA